jgi:hypothetical protein
MIKNIARWLDRSQSTVLMNGNSGKAKSLLDQLEAWGMQAPSYFDKNYYDEPECDGMISEWESEDEKE